MKAVDLQDRKAPRDRRHPPTRSLTDSLTATIVGQIRDGSYRAGDKLPSLREMAALHGIAKNTVVAAFERLVADGWIEPRRGSGFYVRRMPAQRPEDGSAAGLTRARDLIWLMREQLRAQPGMLALGDGFPPTEWLSDNRLDKYHHRVARTGVGSLFRYGDRYGYTPLRHQLVRKLGDFGIGARTGNVVLTQGANDALDIVIRYFLPPDAPVLVDDPGYYLLFGKLKLAGARIIGVPRRHDGPDTALLARLVQTHRPRLFFTQSVAHNPTGSDTSIETARRVLDIAEAHNLLIVESDPLADFKPTDSVRLSALDQLERTIYVGSFSKSYSATLRVGFVACNASLASDLADIKALVHVNSSEYCERTLEVILADGHYHRHMCHLRDRLRSATHSAMDRLERLGAELFARSDATLYAWARFGAWTDTLQLAEQLAQHHAFLAPGRVFCVDPQLPCEWARFNVAAVNDPRFASIMQRLTPR